MQNVLKLLFILLLIYSGCGAPGYSIRVNQSQNHIDNNQYDEAKIEIMNLINDYPDKPEPYYLLGMVNYGSGKYSECLLNFGEAERRGINKTREFYLTKGVALYRTGNFTEAEKNFIVTTELQSTGIAQKYLGLIRYKLGDYSGSIDAFRKSTSINNDTNSLYIYGMALYNQGMNSESLDIFMQAYKLSPDDEKILFQTANLLMLNGQNNNAISMYSKIPSGSFYEAESIYNRAEAYIRIGDFKKAVKLLQDYQDYIDMKPDDYEALFNLSSALIKTGEYVSAADILSELIEESYSIKAVYNLGLANHRLGKYAESVYYLSKAVDQDPENIIYRYAYGLTLTEYGDIKEAMTQMEAIITLDPENEDANEWLNKHSKQE